MSTDANYFKELVGLTEKELNPYILALLTLEKNEPILPEQRITYLHISLP